MRDELGLDPPHVIRAEGRGPPHYLASSTLSTSAKATASSRHRRRQPRITSPTPAALETLVSLSSAHRVWPNFSSSLTRHVRELKALRQHVENALAPVEKQVGKRTIARAVATSGTVENVAAICAYRHGTQEIEPVTQLRVTRADLKGLIADLSDMSREERLRVPGMDARRVDAVLPAAMVLQSLMRMFDIAEFEHCESALREGMIVDHSPPPCRPSRPAACPTLCGVRSVLHRPSDAITAPSMPNRPPALAELFDHSRRSIASKRALPRPSPKRLRAPRRR